MSYTDEQKREAIKIVNGERTQWQDELVYVTPDVAFKMRQLIENVRKNYWGVFQSPYDEASGREKIWMPMTMRDVEIVWKNSDLDLKDMMFRAKTIDSIYSTEVVRYVVRNYLEKMYFGEILDETGRQMIMDGTVVWKTWEESKKMKRKTVDLLNIYIDPTEESIQSAYRFTERSLSLPSGIRQMTGWDDTKGIKGKQNIDKVEFTTTSGMNRTTGKFVDVWETWGKIPLWLITDSEEDKKSEEEVDGHIVVSGLMNGDKKRVHLIEKNTKKDADGNIIKPYEEGRMAKITGRWYGLGVAEREMALQEWMNATSNARINRQIIAQLGLFKIRNGSGVTPQMLSQLSSSGAVPVNNMDDIQQFQIQEPGATSYNDDNLIKEWAQSITAAYPVASGESLPASQTATASSIQSANSKTSYTMIKNAMGFFLQRWMDRHALPIIAKGVTKKDVIRVIRDADGYKELTDRIVGYYAEDYITKNGKNIDPQSMQMAMQVAEDELRRRPQLFFEMTQDIIADGLESYFYTNNESLDTQSTVQNLISTLQLAPEYKDETVRQIYDLMGLPIPRPAKSPAGGMQQGTGEVPGEQTVQDKTQMIYGTGQGNSAAVTQG
jgi:hypothetical protein